MKIHKDQQHLYNIGYYSAFTDMTCSKIYPDTYKWRIYHKGYEDGVKERRLINLLEGKKELKVNVSKATFNNKTQSWETSQYKNTWILQN